MYELADVLDEQAWLAGPSDPDRARDRHLRALVVRRDHGLRLGYADSLDALAGLAVAEDAADAVRLLAAADAARTAMGYPRPPVDRRGTRRCARRSAPPSARTASRRCPGRRRRGPVDHGLRADPGERPPAATERRLGRPDAGGGRGRAAGHRRAVQPGDRRPAVHEPEHGQVPPGPRVRQGRCRQPHRARLARRRRDAPGLTGRGHRAWPAGRCSGPGHRRTVGGMTEDMRHLLLVLWPSKRAPPARRRPAAPDRLPSRGTRHDQ